MAAKERTLSSAAFSSSSSPPPPVGGSSSSSLLLLLLLVIPGVQCIPEIVGWRPESSWWSEVTDGGHTTIFANTVYRVRLYGRDLWSSGSLTFTPKVSRAGQRCDDMRTTKVFKVSAETADTAVADIELPLQRDEYMDGSEGFYFCLNSNAPLPTAPNESSLLLVEEQDNSVLFIHQGNASYLHIRTKEYQRYLLPLWLQIIIISILLVLSGLFSGLNLGLMSLDKTELDIMINSGTPNEKRYAKAIKPLRKRGNFLLCTILLGNVLVNNTLAILLDDLTGSGISAVVGATLAIVIFGEIIPQAVCSRHGLAVGARTKYFTMFFMIVTFPLSYPISKLLDCILGEEIGYVYNRDRLRELLRLTEQEMDLVKDEMNIITGALELSKKTVKDIMTKLEDIIMVEYSSILDFDTINYVMTHGYTRIPVYEKDRSNIVALLNIKDLAFIDPDDRTPLKTIIKFYDHPVNKVFEDTKLDVMLQDFKKGRSHMAVVQKVNDEGSGDPFYETVGVVTLEDVIEEIIQSEIVDETDTVMDNRAKAPRKGHTRDFSVFNQPDNHNYPQLSAQQALATYQFLSINVVPFRKDFISDPILQKMLKQNIVMNFRFVDPCLPENFLYRSGKPCDCFIMILQGRVEVEFGKENLSFEGGPFAYFGVNALIGSLDTLQKQTSSVSIVSLGEFKARPLDYVPDFTVKAKTDLQYIRIRRSDYIAARHATLLERKKNSTHGGSDDYFDEYRSRTQVALTPDQTRSDTDSLRDDLSPKDVIVKTFADRSHKDDSTPSQTRSPKRVNSDSSESHHASLEIPLIGSSGPSLRPTNIS